MAGEHFIDGLKPCPFCGGEKVYMDEMPIDAENHYFIMCRECGANGPFSALSETAQMLWEVRQP